jgi:hypothetical protein
VRPYPYGQTQLATCLPPLASSRPPAAVTCRDPIEPYPLLPRLRVRWVLLLAVPFVAVIIAALQLTQQPVLWNVTEPGMTVEEVRRALPKAVPPAEPKRLANGLELKLVAAGVDNLERAFDAELYFGADGLQMVRLLPTRALAATAATSEFEALRHAATLRYGKERADAAGPGEGVVAQARWVAGPVVITLRLERSGAMGLITMTYATAAVAGRSS